MNILISIFLLAAGVSAFPGYDSDYMKILEKRESGWVGISSGGHEDDGEDPHGDYNHAEPEVKIIKIPYPQPVPIKIPQPVVVKIPQPYPVPVKVPERIEVPVVKTVEVPVEKHIPVKVEKNVPFAVIKHVPVYVDKHVPIHVPKPVPVQVPVIKYIHHYSKGKW